MAAIVVDALSKNFLVRQSKESVKHGLLGRWLRSSQTREVAAVRDVSFRIAPGERVAFIGPNEPVEKPVFDRASRR